ncbi:hypothetical protein ES332_A09G090500v1 [Gossypium tomentosum]|uniref:Uncharacterized protein n=1 Tax=Gossypium tomentosum TaxID=34277 RepID=A0A5D2P2Y6_GOSTO|nr:hypothetical protein ES332_A09G090500v1 [Gossypium tomentosum]
MCLKVRLKSTKFGRSCLPPFSSHSTNPRSPLIKCQAAIVDDQHPQAMRDRFMALEFSLSLRFRRSEGEPIAYFQGTVKASWRAVLRTEVRIGLSGCCCGAKNKWG